MSLGRSKICRNLDPVFFQFRLRLKKKKMKDSNVKMGENDKNDILLASACCEAIMEICFGLPEHFGKFDVRRKLRNDIK